MFKTADDLILETSIVALDKSFCTPHQVKPGKYAKVSVADNGIGMDEATRQRIFDPFFTTKTKGRGTGLGLASAFGIVKNHAGMITVDSEINRGSTFSVYLPLSDKAVQKESAPVEKMISGSGTIVLVDDEEMVIDVARAMLKKLGYRVIVCRSGPEAIDTVAEKGQAIDLVILDLIMPGMEGGKVFDRIRSLRPQLPVILSSGYSIDGQAASIMGRGCNVFMQKPYNLYELSQKIRTILG